jgi:UDP-2,4-diacetamido-2,4,6-trideoxy-beta-L-altropyranose hydrolase
MRCLALAEALNAQGAACAFAAPPAAAAVLDAFASDAIERLDQSGLATDAPGAITAWGADVVVVDHYDMDATHERALRQGRRRIVVIDDLADRPHDCDVLIDPSLGRKGADYAELVPEGTQILTGPNHALIRAGFAAARPEVLKRRSGSPPIRRLLISMGLTDVGGITGQVLQVVQPLAQRLQIEVVVGREAPSRPALERSLGLSLHVDALNMAEMLTEADIGIGGGGASVWERACLGLPSIDVILADNQRAQALALADRGGALTVDMAASNPAARLEDAFVRLRDDVELRARMSRTSAAMCDGKGAERTAREILKSAPAAEPRPADPPPIRRMPKGGYGNF